ncbi:MAG: DUF1211 domain-containing protein [Chitinophagaceae bacterium]|nr:DUF1211 domain-containing protein [Chitinophagaceae bacterium]
MLRKKIFDPLNREPFRHRSIEIVRIEALSDAVFAFSVSLLVASLEVPQTFEELKIIVQGALPFLQLLQLYFFWYQQYMYFRRYGLNDLPTIVLNLCYLAIILFYIYPLKFLFSVLLTSWTGIDLFPKAAEKGLAVLHTEDFAQLIILFSIGYFLIWMIIFLLYKRALHFSSKLELNQYEILFTRKEKRGALWNALIGISAIILAWSGAEGIAGLCYLSIPILLFLNQQLFNHQLKKKIKPGK